MQETVTTAQPWVTGVPFTLGESSYHFHFHFLFACDGLTSCVERANPHRHFDGLWRKKTMA
jgi:hypothetical protein